jgi:L-rhamnose mutarotase
VERVGHVWRVHPGRGEDYDRRHAEIWPELDALLREAGVKSYTIYRSGEILFSHMEVDDYDALVERFNGDPVAQRWEEEMSELIFYPNADPETGWPERLREVWDLGPEPPRS